jgi:transcriptional regulator with XRE-family HTH domain
MELIDAETTAQLHRESYIATLTGMLRWGDKGAFARRAGISPAYLSRLLRPSGPIPSLDVARRLTAATPLSPVQQRDLYDHLVLASGLKTITQAFVRRDPEWLRRYALGELNRALSLGVYSTTPIQARRFYGAVIRLGQALLPAFHGLRLPLLAALTHILLHDALSVMDRPAAALFHARMAETLLEQVDPTHDAVVFYTLEDHTESRHAVPRSDLHVNALRSVATSLNHLGLYPQGAFAVERAARLPGAQRNPTLWQSHLLRDQLSAVGRDPRLSANDLVDFRRRADRLTEQTADDLGAFLIDLSLGRAYLVRGRLDTGAALLVKANDQLDHLRRVGQLHRAMLVARLATLYRLRGDARLWHETVAQALTLARQAGLTRVERELLSEHGALPEWATVLEAVAGSVV